MNLEERLAVGLVGLAALELIRTVYLWTGVSSEARKVELLCILTVPGLELVQATCSMSRAGDCYDNAVAESFFASLKKECVSRRPFATRTEAYDAIASYIDGFYNQVRRHSALGYISPIDYEHQHRGASAA